MFARFLAIYGARFSRLWAGADPEEVKRVWAGELRRFDPDQVGRAIERCAAEIENPPNLPEFLKVVRESYIPPVRAMLPGYPVLPPLDLIELQIRREYPKEANPPWRYWAKWIMRLTELGRCPSTRSYEIAREVLGVRDVAEFAEKYPPAVA